ncbi:MAG: hypothetical protein ACJ75I_02130 [Solirubrobacterales bacterium]
MRQWIRSHLTYANVMVTILAFVVLGGGTALASYVISSNSQVGPGTISGHHPPTEMHANVIGGSLNGQDVNNNSLTGADVAESKLGQVPSALLGGYGRWAGGSSCNPSGGIPNAGPYINCATVTVDLPAPARVLLMGQATGLSDDGRGKLALGDCRLGSENGPFSDSTISIDTTTQESVSPVAVSNVFQPGEHTFDIECNDAGAPVVGGGNIHYQEVGIAAVAISPN